MNVLVDRHHAGLYRSLQLLAERLGWSLYAPTGMAWWDEGYWAFGRWTYSDDRLARQFLTAEGADPEFPDAPIAYVTLAEAQAMPWAIVIATVPDDEPGFARFAREHGARYVVQVGNTGQEVDWSLDPLAIVSSGLRIAGPGVRYHQEMEPVAYHEAQCIHCAASFVNCMPSMGTCWDLLETARRSVKVAVHGIDGPEGVIKPYSALIEAMGKAGWGWHDKAQGDGFGHVIHSWAAVGRPLVGHASHYRGQLAETLWQDGVTCIDLDRHDIGWATERILTITRPEYQAMSEAIRSRFDDIDHAAEAAAIADLLAAVPA